jgi:hypothetical protein
VFETTTRITTAKTMVLYDSTNLNQRSSQHMPYDADAHNDADAPNDDTTAGSGEFIPSLTCRLIQKLPIIPSKSKVMAQELEQGAVLGAV